MILSCRKVGEVGMKEYIVRYENEYLQLLPNKMQELVRCKDCKRRETYDCPVHIGCSVDGYDEPDDWFCAEGERKEEE